MNVPKLEAPRTEGSSLVLAILVGVAALVVIALMLQTATSVGGKERKAGPQQDAIAETLDVFNRYDSAMERPSAPAESGGTATRVPPKPMQPMHLTDPGTPSRTPRGPGAPPAKGGAAEQAPAYPPRPQASILPSESAMDLMTGIGTPARSLLAIATGFDLASADAVTGDQRTAPQAFLQDPSLGAALGEPILAPIELGEMPVTGAPDSTSGNALPTREPAADSGLQADAELDVALREAAAVREGFSSPAQPAPINRLSAPLFSRSSGTFAPGEFNMKLKLSNPNPARVSRILYSVDGGEWKPLESEFIEVSPGAEISAFCESTDRDWDDSPVERREFLLQGVGLSPPQVQLSALRFDAGANRRISIAISNPNRDSVSRVEYRFGGSPWQVYREPVKIDGSVYGASGVRIEARVVGVMGLSGRQATDSVSVDLQPALAGVEEGSAADARRSDSIIGTGKVDLGAPDFAHGYSARDGAQLGPHPASSDGAAPESFLLETFEAYRRYRDRAAVQPAGGLDDAAWPGLGMEIPAPGHGSAAPLLVERAPGQSVLERDSISLFESAGAGALQ